MTRLSLWLRMLRNLFVYGRPFPPQFIFKESKEPKE